MKKTFTIVSVLVLLAIAGCVLYSFRYRGNRSVEARDVEKPWEVLAKKSDLQRKIAMFLIPVNATVDGTFTDFELKATTNNFSHSSTELARLQFYGQSEIADSGISPSQAEYADGYPVDRMWLYQPGDYTDNRSWTYIGNTIGFTGKPLTVAVLVDTTCLLRHPQDASHPEDDWLVNTNTELIWSWHRVQQNGGSTVHEYIPGTSKALWRPIMPVAWLSEFPEWATQGGN